MRTFEVLVKVTVTFTADDIADLSFVDHRDARAYAEEVLETSDWSSDPNIEITVKEI